MDDYALQVSCGYCGQPAGEWCRTASGARASWLHGARTTPFYDAWRNGYRDGQKDGIDYATRQAEQLGNRHPIGWQGAFVDAVAGLVNLHLEHYGRGSGKSTARRLLAARIVRDGLTRHVG